MAVAVLSSAILIVNIGLSTISWSAYTPSLCLLQVIPERMSDCSYFLEGQLFCIFLVEDDLMNRLSIALTSLVLEHQDLYSLVVSVFIA